MMQFNYVKIGKKDELKGQLKKLLRSERPSDKEKLHDLCEVNGIEYSINQGEWIAFSQFRNTIPLKNDDPQDYLRKRLFFEVNDSASIYYVVIDDFKSKESISPIEIEAGSIRKILLNKRKAEMLHKMEEDLYNEAIKKKKYEIYKTK
jgi:hypothetical protein